jgi:3-hydroxybutyrate dehydrogenase
MMQDQVIDDPQLVLRGKTALITGSYGGLGYAIAQRLGREGVNIVLHGLASEASILEAKEKLQSTYQIKVHTSCADLRHPDQIEHLMHQAALQFGRIDIVINNAVLRHVAPIDQLRVTDCDEGLAVNLSAAFHTTRLSLPAMRQAGWGRIVNVASVFSYSSAENRIGYITTKTALLGMTRAVAIETAKTGITCNAICPGTTPTPPILSKISGLAEQQGVSFEQAAKEYLAARQPTGRFVEMKRVADLVAFICSDSGADMTGAALAMDGGWTAA